MGKVAFVYSGQGDQYPGMGKELAAEYPVAEKVFVQCDKMRPGTTFQCFIGSAELLQETKITQPCLFALEMAATEVLKSCGIQPDAVTGFSLGEIVAATASGLFTLETGFRMVCKRGDLMQAVAEDMDTTMVAVVRLTSDQVQQACSHYADVYPVNFNAPGQITVSGRSAQILSFAGLVREMGGRAIPLKVNGAFHSPFMQKAADAFAEELSKIELLEQRIPLYSNLTGELYTKNARELLSRQICNPVQWEQLVRNMIADGIDTFIEIGPGRTLTNLIRRIDSSVTARTYTEYLEEAKLC